MKYKLSPLSKSIFITSLLLIITITPLFSDESEKLKILYTSSLNGNLEGCDCKDVPKAGLVKRAAYLKNIKDRSNIILLDTGDIFDIFPDRLLEEKILNTYKDLKYDAILIGDQDLSSAFDLISLNNDIFQSNNVIFNNKLENKPKIIKRNGINIGIVSITEAKSLRFLKDDIKSNIFIYDSIKTAQTMLNDLIPDTDIQLLLYHGTYDKALNIAQLIPDYDLIIVGHEQKLIEPETKDSPLIISPGEEGNWLGILEVEVKDKKITSYNNLFKLFDFKKDKDDPSVRKEIEEYKKNLLLK